MNRLLGLIFFVVLVGVGCEKSGTECCVYPEQFSEFIFGTYYGECIGDDCVQTFKIVDGRIYEDSKDQYLKTAPYEGEWTELDHSLFEKIAYLPNEFPTALFDEAETTLGMPDAGDWGGIYVEVQTEKGNRFHWQIDTMKENLPEYLHAFVDAVMRAMEELE